MTYVSCDKHILTCTEEEICDNNDATFQQYKDSNEDLIYMVFAIFHYLYRKLNPSNRTFLFAVVDSNTWKRTMAIEVENHFWKL